MVKRAAAIALLAALAAACTPAPPAPVYSTGEFQVTGSGSVTHADIYYRAFGGASVAVLYNVALPWSHSFDVVQTGDEFFLAARSNDNTAAPTDILTVEVFLNAGSIVTQSISNDPFGYVAVYGTAP